MRFLHTSDWHLGRVFHGEGLSAAHELYLDHLVELVKAEKVDALVVSGDIYDRALPNPLTVSLLDDTLHRLLETGTRVVLTSGNHDSAIRLGFGSRVMEHSGLFIRTNLAGLERPVPIPSRRDDFLAGRVVTIPFFEPTVASAHLDAADTTHAAVLAAAAARGRAHLPDDGLPSVVMAHAFFAGATTSESERDICVGGLGVAPQSIVEPFDYAALGHLHRPQSLTDRIRYSGSPVPMSFGEAGHAKGTWLVDLSAGAVRCDFIEAPSYRELAILRGTLDALLADPSLAHAERAWCQVTLTDEIRPASAMDRVRARFPHTLRLMFDTPRPANQPATYAERVAGRSDVELCGDFLAHVRGGRGASATERTAVAKAVAYATRAQSEPSHLDALLPLEALS